MNGHILRKGFTEYYNRNGRLKINTDATSGEIVGFARLVANGLLTTEEKALADESRIPILEAKIDGLKSAFTAGYEWLNDVEIIGYFEVPSEIPGTEDEDSITGRQWRLISEIKTATDVNYRSVDTWDATAGDLIVTALVRLTQVFSGVAGFQTITDVVSNNTAVNDAEIFGQTELAYDARITCAAHLRCDAVHSIPEVTEVPEVPEVPEAL